MPAKKFDLIDFIIRYESGELGARDTLILFAALITSGMAWSLQGSYGRAARNLLENGWVIEQAPGRYVPNLEKLDEMEAEE